MGFWLPHLVNSATALQTGTWEEQIPTLLAVVYSLWGPHPWTILHMDHPPIPCKSLFTCPFLKKAPWEHPIQSHPQTPHRAPSSFFLTAFVIKHDIHEMSLFCFLFVPSARIQALLGQGAVCFVHCGVPSVQNSVWLIVCAQSDLLNELPIFPHAFSPKKF